MSAQLDRCPTVPMRVGKALPMDPYTGEDTEVWWEERLPTLERAVVGIRGLMEKRWQVT